MYVLEYKSTKLLGSFLRFLTRLLVMYTTYLLKFRKNEPIRRNQKKMILLLRSAADIYSFLYALRTYHFRIIGFIL